MKDPDNAFANMKGDQKKINLLDIEEGKNEVKQEDVGTRRLLPGFTMANVKIHLLSDDLDKLYTKQKYHNLFDIGVLSIHSSNKISKEFNYLFKKGAKVHVETADMLVPLNKDQRKEFRKKVEEKCSGADWVELANPPYTHHMFYQVDKEETETIGGHSTAADTFDIDGDFNLDDLVLN